MNKWQRCLILLIIPLAFLFYLQGNFAYPVRGDYSDLVISHLPNAEFLRRSLANGEIPLWSPLLFAGYPFAANPLSGLHYPPGWLALLFPLPLGFNLVTALHLFLAGLGMFLFLKREGLGDWPALAGAVVFQAMPKLIAHYAAGHLTLVYAVCLTPWVLWAEQKRAENQGAFFWRVGAGIALALVALADSRWAPYAAALWLAFALRGYLDRRRKGATAKFSAWLGGIAAQGLVVAILTAALWLPLLEFVPLSTRAQMTAAERESISLPADNLLGLFIPSMGSYAEWELYAGALPWLLLVFTLVVPELRRKVWFWLGLLGVVLVASLGSIIPGYSFISNLPGFSLLRVPARVLFLSGFTFAVLTGFALDFLARDRVEQKPEPVFFMVPFAAFTLLLAAGMGFFLDGYYEPFLWAGVALLIALVLILAAEKRWLTRKISQAAFLLFLVLELGGMDARLMILKAPENVLHRQDALLDAVSPAAGELYRVYSPSFSLPQYVTGQRNLAQVDGIDPMQLSAYVTLFSQASGIPIDGYTVTLPPFSQDRPQKANASYTPDAQLLGMLNTKYVLSAFPLESAGLHWVEDVNGVQIYENANYRQRAWVEDSDANIRNAKILSYRANQVILEAEGPGKLVLADANYPGWQVRVDGQAGVILPYLGILRSVQLEAGTHRVGFVFRPLSVYVGWGSSLLGWAFIAVISLKKRRGNAVS